MCVWDHVLHLCLLSDGLAKQQRDSRRSHHLPSTRGPSVVSKASAHTHLFMHITASKSYLLPATQFARCTCRRACTETLTDRDGLRAFAFPRARAKHGGSLCSELVSDGVDNSTRTIVHSHPCCTANVCDRPLIENRYR